MYKLLIPLILFLVGLAVIFMFIIPGWQHFLSVRADGKRLQDINAEVDALTQKRDALVDQINGITKDNLLRLDQMVPLTDQGPEFLVSIQKLAMARNLHINRLDLGATIATKPKISVPAHPESSSGSTQQAQTAGYQTVSASLDVTSSYESFKDFLRAVESSIRITDVSNLSLMPSEKGFNMKLSLDAYYQ